ncbi:MAG: hypothetical protein DWQ36_20105, partial [Acidobacteria bacterium]
MRPGPPATGPPRVPVRRDGRGPYRDPYARLAAPYRLLEWIAFGSALQDARGEFAARIGAGDRVLLVGDGDGRFGSHLAAIAAARGISADVSLAML